MIVSMSKGGQVLTMDTSCDGYNFLVSDGWKKIPQTGNTSDDKTKIVERVQQDNFKHIQRRKHGR